MKKQLLIGLLATLFIDASVAQTESKTKQAPPQTESSNPENNVPDKKAPDQKADTEDFIPSEEISEDLSVSFPVDI